MERGRERHNITQSFMAVFHWIIRIPESVLRLMSFKRRARAASERMTETSVPLQLHEAPVRELLASWEQLRKSGRPDTVVADCFQVDDPEDSPTPVGNSPDKSDLSGKGENGESDNSREFDWGQEEEISVENGEAIIFRIRHQTRQANRNNVTRTEAYRAFYFCNPEIHWALLAHIVSRNGGWNMTDLKGELLPRLLPPAEREADFSLLERANALIFSDAYPQLLLYETGKRAGRDISCLLPHFGVSRFMEKAWAQYWKTRQAPLLTTALIVNEQHFIESRVVRSDYYKRRVLDRLAFRLQSPLQTNAVFMPYGAPLAGEMKLAGLVLEHFDNLEERIEFGKRLYAILFGVPEVREGVLSFVRAVHHSGSRADYAPHLFTYEQEASEGDAADPPRYTERMSGCRLLRSARPLYSPKLEDAWPDMAVEQPERGDWVEWADDIGRYFRQLPMPPVFEITSEHCLGINKMELAVIAAERLKRG